MDYLTLIAIPAITGAVYALIEVIKRIVGNNETFNRFIPLISLGIGIIAGVICFYFIPNIIPAPNVVVAIVLGGASGLGATGTNQIIKQLNDKAHQKEKDE